MSDETPPKKRLLLKLSGEALMGTEAFGLHLPTLEAIAADVKACGAGYRARYRHRRR